MLQISIRCWKRFLLVLISSLLTLTALVSVGNQASYEVLLVQLIDLVGLPSTLHLKNIHCRGCNSFNATKFIHQPSLPASCKVSTPGSLDQVQPPFLVVLVISDHVNIDRRVSIRKTWAKVTSHRHLPIRTYFVIGRQSSDIAKYEIDNFGDILQMDADDNYRHLANKTLFALDWITKWCGETVKFIMKTDDDSMNFLDRFVDYLLQAPSKNFVGGQCSSGEVPNRRPRTKWTVPVESFPGSVFPIHCKGRAYIFSSDAALKIVKASANALYNSMEDVFITGVCRAIAGLSCVNIKQIPKQNDAISDCDVMNDVMNVHHVNPEKMFRLWSIVTNVTWGETVDCPR